VAAISAITCTTFGKHGSHKGCRYMFYRQRHGRPGL
jgi:hypothetical protein